MFDYEVTNLGVVRKSLKPVPAEQQSWTWRWVVYYNNFVQSYGMAPTAEDAHISAFNDIVRRCSGD